jgi:hypothetical protein
LCFTTVEGNNNTISSLLSNADIRAFKCWLSFFQVGWLTPAIPPFRKLRQVNHQFENQVENNLG